MSKLWERLQGLFTSGGAATAGAGEENGAAAGEPALPSQQRKLTDAEILLGRKGENHAASFLKSKGYRILARNLSTPLGEIDIVARDKEFLVFVEVKTRVSDDAVAPEEQVNPHKRNQLTKAAKYYLGRYPPPMPPARFDVVSIVWPAGGHPTVKHIEHAFEATF